MLASWPPVMQIRKMFLLRGAVGGEQCSQCGVATLSYINLNENCVATKYNKSNALQDLGRGGHI